MQKGLSFESKSQKPRKSLVSKITSLKSKPKKRKDLKRDDHDDVKARKKKSHKLVKKNQYFTIRLIGNTTNK